MGERRLLKITNAGEVRFYEDDDDGSDWVAIKAPSGPTTYNFTLPTAVPANTRLLTFAASGALAALADGTAGQALTTNADGTYSWATINAVGLFDLQFAYDAGSSVALNASEPVTITVDTGAALDIIGADQILTADAGYIGLGLTLPLSADLTTLGTPWHLSRKADGSPHSVLLAGGANASPNAAYSVKTRGVGSDANTAVVSNDVVHLFRTYGADGAAFQAMAEFSVEVDGAVSAGSVPSRFVFRIDDAGMQERFRIDRAGCTMLSDTGTALEITTVSGKGIMINHHSDTNEGFRLDGDGNNTLFAITQDGNATAALIQTAVGIDQACLQLHAKGNSAALQITQDDNEDAIDVGDADIRCSQVICSTHCAIAHTGAVQFSDSVSVLLPSPDYFDVLALNASDELVLGNSTKDYPVRIQVDTEDITLEAGGSTVMSVASVGGVAIGSYDFTVGGNTRITSEGEVDCKMLSFESEASKTISAGAITLSSGQSIVAVDTEAAAAADDLDTIAIDSSVEGRPLIVLRGTDNARVVTVKDGTNLRLAGDMVLDDTTDRIVLLYTGSIWVELCRSSNG